MLSSTCTLNTVLRKNILYQFQSVCYSIAVNVKEPLPAAETPFGKSLAQEWQNAKPLKEMPGLTKYQLFRGFMKGGDFADASLNDLMLMCRQRFGDISFLPGLFGQPNTVVTFTVEDFEKVHRTEGASPVRPGGEAFIYYRTQRADKFYEEWHGLTDNGDGWAKFRHAVNPVLMQPRNTKLYLEPMQGVNEEFVRRIRDIRDPNSLEVPDTFIEDINHLTFESVAVIALDTKLGIVRNPAKIAPEVRKLFDNLQAFLESFFELGLKPPLYRYIKTPTYQRFENAMDEVHNATLQMVDEAVARIESQPGNGEGNSVFEKLAKIDKKMAVVMAMDMLIAGADTTSSALTGALLAIAKSPTKQAKLRAEILAVLPNKSERFTVEKLKNLPYLRACLKESLRMYPLTFGNTRETGRDLALSGYRVPKGTRVMINSNLLLNDERYFPRPLEFQPERWLRDESSSNLTIENLSPFVYLPFGFGPRSCVGRRIADLEMELTLANLVRNFHIEFNYSTENAFKNYFINTPAIPLKFKFTDVNY